MSNGGYPLPHNQTRGGAELPYNNVATQQVNYDELRLVDNRSNQLQRTLPPLPPPHHHHHSSTSRASAASAEMPANHANGGRDPRDTTAERGRKRRQKSPVDWVAFFGGKPPAEIIEIHDDDSPAPPAVVHQLQRNNAAAPTQHVDKKRRVNGPSGDVPQYSTTNTPYSYTNGTSTESLLATTAPTSLGSQASSGVGLDTSAQTGQKRKRTTRTNSDFEKRKQETAAPGAARGYLAEYGEYQTPPRQKKQKDVVVPAIHDVRSTSITGERRTGLTVWQREKSKEKIDDEDGHYIVHDGSKLGERYSLVSLLGQGTFGKVVRAVDVRSRKEVAVKIIRAVPKVRKLSTHPPPNNTADQCIVS